MTELWQFHDQLASWRGPVDVAIGGIGEDESWREAAAGAYDARWTKSLSNLRALRSGRGTTYIRFAHEMNGDWFPWSVDQDNYKSFLSAWRRFRVLQQKYFPESKLVFCLNRETNGSGMDWRRFYPGSRNVDVVGVDYYNAWPYVGTDADWKRSATEVDRYGAPKGIEQYLKFARSKGVPLAVPEWAGNADWGDSRAYVRGMHDFFKANSGIRAGHLAYEVYFNVVKDGGRYNVYGTSTRLPKSASTYQELF
jgi:hypothetical protein